MQSQQGSVAVNLAHTLTGSRRKASVAYFAVVQDRKGYFNRLNIVQDYALANLRSTAFRAWDWVERTLRQQQYYHPDRPAELRGMAVSDIAKELNVWAPEGRQLSQRTVERALHELAQSGFLEIEHRYHTSEDGLRRQLPSVYRLLCPPALRCLLEAKAPSFTSDSQENSHRHETAKARTNPPSKLSEQKKINSKKEKSQGPTRSGNTTPVPDQASSPKETPVQPKHQAAWQSLFQHFREQEKRSLLETLTLMHTAETLWETQTTGRLEVVQIQEDGWHLLN